MSYRTFLRYNVIGGVIWAVGVTMLGYGFGQVAMIRDHIELALVGIVLISAVPIGWELLTSRRAPSSPVPAEDPIVP